MLHPQPHKLYVAWKYDDCKRDFLKSHSEKQGRLLREAAKRIYIGFVKL